MKARSTSFLLRVMNRAQSGRDVLFFRLGYPSDLGTDTVKMNIAEQIAEQIAARRVFFDLKVAKSLVAARNSNTARCDFVMPSLLTSKASAPEPSWMGPDGEVYGDQIPDYWAKPALVGMVSEDSVSVLPFKTRPTSTGTSNLSGAA